MRLLASAFSCCPGHGSEPGVGWNTVEQLSKEHEVWVLVDQNWQARVEAAFDQQQYPRIHFEFVRIPLLTELAEHFSSSGAVWWLYYYLWQFAALLHAWRLHQRIGFEACQHVTFVKYNTPSLLHLLGIPFIFGPVGGAEKAPLTFFREFGLKTYLIEAARITLQKLALFDPLLRWCVRRSTLALGVTEDTAAELRKLGAKHVQVLPAVALSDAEITQITAAKEAAASKEPSAPLTLLYVGRLIPWKGIHLGLRALAQCTDKTLRYRIIGDGPLRPWLQAEAQRLGIADRVEFTGPLPRNQVLQAYATADAFLYPSLHDSGGNAVIEAMCAGLPILCLDRGGPGLIVTEGCGWKVRASSSEEAVAQLTTALTSFAKDSASRATQGIAARQRVLDAFAWKTRGQVLCGYLNESEQSK